MTDAEQEDIDKDLDNDIDRHEFLAGVQQLAADIFLRGMTIVAEKAVFRVAPNEAVYAAASLVMAARDEAILRKITASIAKAKNCRDPLAETPPG